MAAAYRAPGVYREDVFVDPRARLPTGIVGFVGFAMRAKPDDMGLRKPLSLDRIEEFAAHFFLPKVLGGFLEDAVRGFFANGGVRCYVVAADPGKMTAEELIRGIESLEIVADLDLLAVPDAMALHDTAAAQRVQRAAIEHCARLGDRFAVLDAPGGDLLRQFFKERAGSDLAQALPHWRRLIVPDEPSAADAALYHPWLQATAPTPGEGRWIPPCGHVAGIFARSDLRVGVFKAPANEEILNALDFEMPVDIGLHEQLNSAGINCLRAFPGRGLRVYGARTLSHDSRWRYIHVRRVFIALRRWIDRNMTWAAFEPNNAHLWLRIQRELGNYLSRLWRAGGLRGATAAEAFYVKCDVETNPTEAREQGQVLTEIGLAVVRPAEFVIVRIVHRPGSSTLS